MNRRSFLKSAATATLAAGASSAFANSASSQAAVSSAAADSSPTSSYPKFPQRHSLALDGLWDFLWLGDADPASFPSEKNKSLRFDETAAVPGCFNLAGVRIGQRGAGLYRTTFAFPAGRSRLAFGGLGLYAKVWLDGVEIAEIKNPYATLAFDLDVKATPDKRHELLVLVDNRFDKKRVPVFNPWNDFYGYGGIYRGVTISQLPETRVERVKVTTLDHAAGRVRLEAHLGGKIPARLRVRHAFDNGAAKESTMEIPSGKNSFVIEAQVPAHRVWSPETPALHTLTLGILSGAGGSLSADDTVIEQFGIRTIATRGQEILLNGKPVRLVGVNRHESHPQFGPAQPAQISANDLAWLRELNANFIRAVHYQPGAEFLAACDREGFLVWAESLGWDQPESDSKNPAILALHREAAVALVDVCLNHPSVIIYGFLNESRSDTTTGRILYETLANTFREADSTRLVSYASNKFEKDICFDLADILSINIYPGWVGERHFREQVGNERHRHWTTPGVSLIRPEIDRMARFFTDNPEHAQKPLLMSEIGTCSLYGIRDRARAQWSEEFQSDYVHEATDGTLSNPRYAGIALWQMFDTQSYSKDGPSLRNKPGGFNLAGLLDEYRRPKLAFDTVKALFKKFQNK